MKQVISMLVVTCVFSVLASAQNKQNNKPVGRTDNRTPQQSVQPIGEENDGYVIGPGDVLSIIVFHEDQLTTKVTVRADGKIALLLLDEIQASGLTPVQLKERITLGLKKFLTEPQVYIIPLEIHSQFVYIVGAVSKPGVYPLATPLRVTELLVLAGGLAEFAKPEQIIIIRDQSNLPDHPNTNVRFPFNYKTFLEGKNYKQDILLQSRDMVIVP
jgi:polysaccharide export outer membrane protein